MTHGADRELDRIRWRCRRGLLELDLMLARFLEKHVLKLSAAERRIFAELLELPDHDLWDLASGAVALPSGSQGQVVMLVRRS